jgi:hypothetical protein
VVLRFNTLLHEEGLDPAKVQLVRHQRVGRDGVTPYSLWRGRTELFDFYQSYQTERTFSVGGAIASFVVAPNGDTLFTGIYDVVSARPADKEIVSPVTGTVHQPDGFEVYDLDLRDALSDYYGRLVIDWGPGARAWVQRAAKQNKTVLAINRSREEPPFPGFDGLLLRSDHLAEVPLSWRTVLSAIGGVYLLVCERNGEQYIGSAYGQSGFWGRWLAYADGRHGGNALLKARGKSTFAISILETAASSATFQDIVDLEARWKRKLGSRAHGLNAN